MSDVLRKWLRAASFLSRKQRFGFVRYVKDARQARSVLINIKETRQIVRFWIKFTWERKFQIADMPRHGSFKTHHGETVMRVPMGVALMIFTMMPAIAGDVPFAEPPLIRHGQPNDAYVGSLGDIMGLTQLRQIRQLGVGGLRIGANQRDPHQGCDVLS
jgi:hypothetical protein